MLGRVNHNDYANWVGEEQQCSTAIYPDKNCFDNFKQKCIQDVTKYLTVKLRY